MADLTSRTDSCQKDARRTDTRTIYAVQALRAFAAAQVLAGHILLDIEHRYHVATFHLTKLPLLTGVDVFFCVSGFIMMLTSWDHFAEKGYRETFLRQRIIRIVPMYYVFTSLMVAVVVVAPNMLGATTNDPMQILTSYLFFPYERADGLAQPVLSVGWTLNYEMFFYSVFAACLYFRRNIALVVMLVFFTSLATINGVFPQAPTCIVFWTDPMILEFVAGAAVAYLYRRNMRIEASSALAVFFVLVALVVFYGRDEFITYFDLHVPRVIQAGGPALLLLVSCTLLMSDKTDKRVPKWLVALGSSSYALYLSHRFGMRFAALLWSVVLGVFHLGPQFTYLYAAIVFIICLLLGELVHRWLEKPMTRFIMHKTKKPEETQNPLVLQKLGKQLG